MAYEKTYADVNKALSKVVVDLQRAKEVAGDVSVEVFEPDAEVVEAALTSVRKSFDHLAKIQKLLEAEV